MRHAVAAVAPAEGAPARHLGDGTHSRSKRGRVRRQARVMSASSLRRLLQFTPRATASAQGRKASARRQEPARVFLWPRSHRTRQRWPLTYPPHATDASHSRTRELAPSAPACARRSRRPSARSPLRRLVRSSVSAPGNAVRRPASRASAPHPITSNACRRCAELGPPSARLEVEPRLRRQHPHAIAVIDPPGRGVAALRPASPATRGHPAQRVRRRSGHRRARAAARAPSTMPSPSLARQPRPSWRRPRRHRRHGISVSSAHECPRAIRGTRPRKHGAASRGPASRQVASPAGRSNAARASVRCSGVSRARPSLKRACARDPRAAHDVGASSAAGRGLARPDSNSARA